MENRDKLHILKVELSKIDFEVERLVEDYQADVGGKCKNIAEKRIDKLLDLQTMLRGKILLCRLEED